MKILIIEDEYALLKTIFHDRNTVLVGRVFLFADERQYDA